jgi:hypothetical protein
MSGGGLVPPPALELEAETRGRRVRRRIALAVFAAGAAYFLLTEHRAHTIQALPWLILALCPLMHLFMHGGHGSHGDSSGAPR